MRLPMEDCLQGIYDFSESNLETYLLAIEAARGCILPRREYVDIAEIIDAAQLKIEILPSRTTPDYGNLEVDPIIKDHMHENLIDIFISHSHSVPKELNYTLMRYGEAYTKMIRDDNTFGKRFNWLRVVYVDYSPLSSFAGELKKICTITVAIRD